jgi:hypothetical protein
MALKEVEFYHGSVFSRLTQLKKAISVKRLLDYSQGFYILDDKLPIHIKHTTKKLSPWRFSFIKTHQDEIQSLKDKYGFTLVIFVCGHDGICCLEFDDFKNVLDYVHEEVEWVAIKRRKGEKYSVSGKDGELKGKVGEVNLIKLICSILNIDNNV